MTYELAKQLKDAGFPYSKRNDEYQFVVKGGEVAIIPTLSELIEACGMYFHQLERLSDLEWRAAGFENFDGDPPINVIYPTPEESVANLWLSLPDKR